MDQSLFDLVSKDINQLRRHLTAVLSDPRTFAAIKELALAVEDVRAHKFILGLGSEYDLTETIRLALTSECLSHIVTAICADDVVDGEELAVAFPLVWSLANSLACRLPRYRDFEDLNSDDTGNFLSHFAQDEEAFGGSAKAPTRMLAWWLCLLSSQVTKEATQLDLYRRVIVGIYEAIMQVDGMTDQERERLDRVLASIESSRKTVLSRKTTATDSATSFPKGVALEGPTKEKRRVSPPITTATTEGVVPNDDKAAALQDAMRDLDSLIGLSSVKTELKRLAAFLKVQQQRRQHGLRESTQTLHFVFTGNPGTGKTTVARIVSKLLYGVSLLKSTKLVECDRSDLVGGYLGQTAIKTDEVIQSALDGVLFIDEAYTLSGDSSTYGHGDMYGDEAINTLLKRMEDYRDRLVVIAAGYPKPMNRFIHANPGLESRFTRYITFEDYSISDLCLIFERICASSEYSLSAWARAFASLLITIAFNQRDERFGNARFIRNVFEKATSLHSERLGELRPEDVTKDVLMTLDADDVPFNFVKNVKKEDIDLSNARWSAECPSCGIQSDGGAKFLGKQVTCKKCSQIYTFPWWSLQPNTVGGIDPEMLAGGGDRRGIIEPALLSVVGSKTGKLPQMLQVASLPVFDGWKDDPQQAKAFIEQGIKRLEAGDSLAALRCFESAIECDWNGSAPHADFYFDERAEAMSLLGRQEPREAIKEYELGLEACSNGHYREATERYLDSLKLDPEFLWAPNNLAWQYATCPESTARNGKEAVKFAMYACQKSDWHCWSFIDTLAASYAEAGDFNAAVKCSERAIRLAPPSKRDGITQMLSLFQAGKPYRDDE